MLKLASIGLYGSLSLSGRTSRVPPLTTSTEDPPGLSMSTTTSLLFNSFPELCRSEDVALETSTSAAAINDGYRNPSLSSTLNFRCESLRLDVVPAILSRVLSSPSWTNDFRSSDFLANDDIDGRRTGAVAGMQRLEGHWLVRLKATGTV